MGNHCTYSSHGTVTLKADVCLKEVWESNCSTADLKFHRLQDGNFIMEYQFGGEGNYYVRGLEEFEEFLSLVETWYAEGVWTDYYEGSSDYGLYSESEVRGSPLAVAHHRLALVPQEIAALKKEWRQILESLPEMVETRSELDRSN